MTLAYYPSYTHRNQPGQPTMQPWHVRKMAEYVRQFDPEATIRGDGYEPVSTSDKPRKDRHPKHHYLFDVSPRHPGDCLKGYERVDPMGAAGRFIQALEGIDRLNLPHNSTGGRGLEGLHVTAGFRAVELSFDEILGDVSRDLRDSRWARARPGERAGHVLPLRLEMTAYYEPIPANAELFFWVAEKFHAQDQLHCAIARWPTAITWENAGDVKGVGEVRLEII